MFALLKPFYPIPDLSKAGILPLSARTLLNKRVGNAIVFGRGQPDLPLRHVGGRVVVAAMDLEQWLREMGGLPPNPASTPVAPAPTQAIARADFVGQPPRRRGRPRKSTAKMGEFA